jgi:hypothetical protein
MKDKKIIKELANFIGDKISSREMWERGDTEVTWNDLDMYNYTRSDNLPGVKNRVYYEMAKDILKFLNEKQKTKN